MFHHSHVVAIALYRQPVVYCGSLGGCFKDKRASECAKPFATVIVFGITDFYPGAGELLSSESAFHEYCHRACPGSDLLHVRAIMNNEQGVGKDRIRQPGAIANDLEILPQRLIFPGGKDREKGDRRVFQGWNRSLS
jgi:hypothetical protein